MAAPNRIYVGNLPPDVKQTDLEAIFERFMPFTSVEIKTAANPSVPAFAFLELATPELVDEAIREKDGYMHGDIRIRVERPRSAPGTVGGTSAGRTAFRIRVTGLPAGTSWQDLKDHCRRAGEIGHADVVTDREAGNAIGVVHFRTREGMEAAISTLDNSEFVDRVKGSAVIRVAEDTGAPLPVQPREDRRRDDRRRDRGYGGGGGYYDRRDRYYDDRDRGRDRYYDERPPPPSRGYYDDRAPPPPSSRGYYDERDRNGRGYYDDRDRGRGYYDDRAPPSRGYDDRAPPSRGYDDRDRGRGYYDDRAPAQSSRGYYDERDRAPPAHDSRREGHRSRSPERYRGGHEGGHHHHAASGAGNGGYNGGGHGGHHDAGHNGAAGGHYEGGGHHHGGHHGHHHGHEGGAPVSGGY